MEPTGLDALVDMISTAIEGGFVLWRATGNSAILPKQILLARNHIKLLFASSSGGLRTWTGELIAVRLAHLVDPPETVPLAVHRLVSAALAQTGRRRIS